MPPKKKTRTANSKADVPILPSASAVTKLQEQLVAYIQKGYENRHAEPGNGDFGGTFQDLVQRKWMGEDKDESNVLPSSLKLLKKAGVLDGSTTCEDFVAKWVTLKDRVRVLELRV